MTSDPRTIRLAIAGVGNCASSLRAGPRVLQGRRSRPSGCPASCTSCSAATTSATSRSWPRSTSTPTKVGLDVGKAIFAGQNNTIKFAEVPDLGVTVLRGPTLDGFGKYYRQVCRGVAGRARRRRRRRCATPGADVLVSLPAGRLRAGAEALRPGLPRRRRRLRQRHPGVHRLRPGVGREVRRTPACRSSATTSRARSAPPSSTASSPACSRTAAWRSTTRTS